MREKGKRFVCSLQTVSYSDFLLQKCSMFNHCTMILDKLLQNFPVLALLRRPTVFTRGNTVLTENHYPHQEGCDYTMRELWRKKKKKKFYSHETWKDSVPAQAQPGLM